MYVCEWSNHRVQKVTINGGYSLQIGCNGSRNGRLSNPCGITVHNDRLYIVDYSNGCISVFQHNGQFCSIIGLGQLNCPYGVTVSGNRHLLVADANSKCMSSFILDGAYVGKFGNG